MESSNAKKNRGGALASQVPPSYSESQPSTSEMQYPPVAGLAYSMGFTANPAMPPLYQAYWVAAGQGPITQPPQHTIFVIPAQPTNEPDYLAYSIFTMLCCCFPLGIVALFYSIQTRDANRFGDSAAARQNSRKAQIFAHSALCVGLAVSIAYIVYVVFTLNRF